MTNTRKPELTDEQWALVLPLLPQGRVRHIPRGRARSDRALFAIITLVVVREQPWSTGAVYGVHASTLQRRWAEWRDAGVFARMAATADGRTATRQWALLVARTSDERAARAGYPPAASARRAGPSDEDRRWAWELQNAFPDSS